MRKIVIRMDAGYAGMDGTEFVLVPDDMTNDALSEYAYQRGLAHAEMYGIYPEADRPEDEDGEDDSWDSDDYSDNIEGWWEDYDPEKHDGLRCPGDESWSEI